jgi:hypothetical protein
MPLPTTTQIVIKNAESNLPCYPLISKYFLVMKRIT